MVKAFKYFNSRRFKLVYGCCDKRGTESEAGKLNRMGFRTRVLSSMEGKKMGLNREKVYLLYKSIKRKWEE
jgi:hypothetical protein